MPDELLESIINIIIDAKMKDGWVSKELMQWTADQFLSHIMRGGEVGDDSPEPLTPEQHHQIQVFSGFKTYHQLRVATDLLYDKHGKQRPFSAFKRDVLAIDQEYNVRYLRAEYDLARANIRSATKWNDLQAIKDVMPFVRYGTAEDERVRHVHALLNGVIKPIDDPFWDTWWPPNGWGCRCGVRPELSDAGSTKVPDDLPPPKTMFATNVGKLGVVFPQGHPYYKAPVAIAAAVMAAAAPSEDASLLSAIRKAWSADTAEPAHVLDRAGALLQDFAERIRPHLPALAINAIKTYTADGDPWNELLQAGAAKAMEVAGIAAMRSALRAFPTKAPGVLYRAVRKPADVAKLKALIANGKPGDVMALKGFTSTTIDPKRALWNKTVMRFHAPAGTPGMYVEDITSTPLLEQEVVLDHGIKVRYLGSESADGVLYIDLAILP